MEVAVQETIAVRLLCQKPKRGEAQVPGHLRRSFDDPAHSIFHRRELRRGPLVQGQVESGQKASESPDDPWPLQDMAQHGHALDAFKHDTVPAVHFDHVDRRRDWKARSVCDL
jgi:hypothetical protein